MHIQTGRHTIQFIVVMVCVNAVGGISRRNHATMTFIHIAYATKVMTTAIIIITKIIIIIVTETVADIGGGKAYAVQLKTIGCAFIIIWIS